MKQIKLQNYKSSTEDANYLSIGCNNNTKHGPYTPNCIQQGKFNIPLAHLINFILNNPDAKYYCMTERRTPYIMYYIDFDLDKNVPNIKTIDIEQFIHFLILKMIDALKFYIVISENDHELKYIYSDRNDNKKNFHLYFPNIILNSFQALAIRNKIIELIMLDNQFNFTKDVYEAIIDEAVYTKSGLKLLFQSKPHEDGYYKINVEKSTYKKIPIQKFDQLKITSIRKKDTLINVELHFNDNDYAFLLEDSDKLYNESLNKHKKNSIKITKKTKINKINNNIIIDDTKTDEILHLNEFKLDIPEEMVSELFRNLSPKRYDNYDGWIKMIFICHNYKLYDLGHEISKKCPITYDEKEINKLYNNNNNLYHKNPIGIGSLFKWSKEDNLIKHNEIVEKYYIQGYYKEVFCDHVNEFGDMENYVVYESSHLLDLDYKNFDTFCIKSPPGTNKTGKMIETITNIQEEELLDRINVIASRVILCSDLHNRFYEKIGNEKVNRPAKLKMQNYSKVEYKSDLYLEKRLIHTPDSLVHMLDEDNKIDRPDLVFIDELESLLEYICLSNTLTNKRKMVFTVLLEHIKKTKYLFMADANMSRFVADFIKNLRNPNKFQMIHNRKKTDDNLYYFMANEYDWMQKLLGYLKLGKYIFICTDSKDFTDLLYKQISKDFPHLKIQVYNVDTKDEDKINMGDVNETWITFQIIIVSPTVIYGINMSKIHFDAVFGKYNSIILARGCYQQIRRIRNIKEKQAFIHFNDRKYFSDIYYPTDIEELRSYVLKHKNEFQDVLNCLNQTYDDGFKLDIDDAFTKLYLYFLSERHKNNNCFKTEIIKAFSENGGRVFFEVKKKTKNKEYEGNKIELMDELKKDRIDALIKADKDIDQFDLVQFKVYKTTHDKNIITVNHIRNVFGLHHLDTTFLEHLGKLYNVDKFYKSLIYLANDNYKNCFIKKYKGKEFQNITSSIFKQTELIKEFIQLFWEDGLLSTDIIDVYSTKNNLTDKQKLFINKKEQEMRILFECLKRKTSPKNSYQLVGLLDNILKEFFGGFVCLSISKRKEKLLNNKRIKYYAINIKAYMYIELLLNKNKFIIEENCIKFIINNYKNINCVYKSIHNQNLIIDFLDLDNHENENYMFIDDIIYDLN